MRHSWILRATALVWAATSTVALACTDGNAITRYFSILPPERAPETVMLRVRITGMEGRVVYGQLDGAFARLSNDGNVRILLREIPVGGSCLEMGPTDGTVFVVGTPVRYELGVLELVATPVRSTHERPRRSSNAELNEYVVDPRYRFPVSNAPSNNDQ